jgi:hypothetical protein
LRKLRSLPPSSHEPRGNASKSNTLAISERADMRAAMTSSNGVQGRLPPVSALYEFPAALADEGDDGHAALTWTKVVALATLGLALLNPTAISDWSGRQPVEMAAADQPPMP